MRTAYEKQRIFFKIIMGIIGVLALYGVYDGINSAVIFNNSNKNDFITNFYQQNNNNFNTTCLCDVTTIINNNDCPPFTMVIYCDTINLVKNVTAITCDKIIKFTNLTCHTSNFYNIQFTIPEPPVYFPTITYVFTIVMFPVIFLMIFITMFIVIFSHSTGNQEDNQ